MNHPDNNSPTDPSDERDRLTKTFAYEYVVFNHDPDHPYLCTGVTDDLMLELEGMSGQFAPTCFKRATNPSSKEVGPALEPCPFCGVKVVPNPMDATGTYHPIMVNNCPLGLTTINWSIAQWNTRVSTDSAGAMVGQQARKEAFDRFRKSVGFQFGFVAYSGLDVATAIEHICASAEVLIVALTSPAVPRDEADSTSS